MRLPAIKSARTVARGKLGEGHAAELKTDVVNIDTIAFTHLFALYRIEDAKIVAVITAEVNDLAREFGSGSHFLCAFLESGHANYGSSDDWADLDAELIAEGRV